MAKSYVPQLLRKSKELSIYITRHQDTINRFVTDPDQQAAIASCSTCLTHLLTLIQRQPEVP